MDIPWYSSMARVANSPEIASEIFESEVSESGSFGGLCDLVNMSPFIRSVFASALVKDLERSECM